MVQGEASTMTRGSTPGESSRKASYDALQKREQERRDLERKEQERRERERQQASRSDSKGNWGQFKNKDHFVSMHFS